MIQNISINKQSVNNQDNNYELAFKNQLKKIKEEIIKEIKALRKQLFIHCNS